MFRETTWRIAPRYSFRLLVRYQSILSNERGVLCVCDKQSASAFIRSTAETSFPTCPHAARSNCLLRVISGHLRGSLRCPLYPPKADMCSALCAKSGILPGFAEGVVRTARAMSSVTSRAKPARASLQDQCHATAIPRSYLLSGFMRKAKAAKATSPMTISAAIEIASIAKSPLDRMDTKKSCSTDEAHALIHRN